jgi:uncharacterized protein
MVDLEQLFASHLANNLLQLIIMPTEQCNLRCTYCYEDFAHGPMDREVVEGLKRFLDRRAPGLDRLWIAWFGGEPLLAFDIIADVQAHIQALARRHPRLQPSASMTTNALLLDRRRLRRLLDLGVNEYQTTLDGPRELHDRKRVRIGGQGTFDRIWANLCAARELRDEFTIVVRVHVDRENHGGLPALIDQYREIFGGDRRFHLFLRPLSRLGGARDAELPIFEPDDGARAVEELRRSARDCDISGCVPSETDSVCYASRANSFVLRADGGLAKCTVAFSDPGNRVGSLRSDGRVEIDARKMEVWLRGLSSRDPAELACPLRGFAESEARMDPRPAVSWRSAGA